MIKDKVGCFDENIDRFQVVAMLLLREKTTGLIMTYMQEKLSISCNKEETKNV